MVGYRQYVPPDFSADFLLGREAYFYGPYSWAFYAHLVAGPTALIVGTILVSDRFRRWAPAWHRRLGRMQVGCVLLLVVPSGLWMARYAMTGAAAGLGLGLLAIVTGICCAAGWRAAVARRFDEHRRWMWRTYLLLCSAVVIRVLGGLATVFELDAEWVYPVSVWVSWVGPLIVFDMGWRIAAVRDRNSHRSVVLPSGKAEEEPRISRMGADVAATPQTTQFHNAQV